jgi:hypothetical protein
MQLTGDLWIEGAYYVDFDHQGQLRIVGPNNHLHFSPVGLYKDKDLTVNQVYCHEGNVRVEGEFNQRELFFHDPAMGHIRKVRDAIEHKGTHNSTFAEVSARKPLELAPNYIGVEQTATGQAIVYKRLYGRHWYGVIMHFPDGVELVRDQSHYGFKIKAPEGVAKIKFVLEPGSDHIPAVGPKTVLRSGQPDFNALGENSKMADWLWQRAGVEINHMVQYRKTSGIYFGTVFPRDWMESADLGALDLVPTARRFMYHESLSHVDRRGVGWHEDIVGEYRYEERRQLAKIAASLEEVTENGQRAQGRLKALATRAKAGYINRFMVDIEPRYMLGLDVILSRPTKEHDLSRIQRVAKYVIHEADRKDLITFKRIPDLFRRHRHDEYFSNGNWRDSNEAFKKVHPILAPYDVNVVFYPQALRAILKYAETLQVDGTKVKQLIDKWDRTRDWYKFINPDGTPGFAMALYDVRYQDKGLVYKKLTVNHTDEAYGFFYGQPPEDEVVAFCQRLLDPKYFYTPSGPTIVGAGDGYNTTQYHGQVIWTKQTALVVGGLHRQLNLHEKTWKPGTAKLVQEALLRTAADSMQAWLKLNSIPELHYDHLGEPHHYSDQPQVEARPNRVQLWSAIGARRIMRAYVDIKGKK